MTFYFFLNFIRDFLLGSLAIYPFLQYDADFHDSINRFNFRELYKIDFDPKEVVECLFAEFGSKLKVSATTDI